MKIVAKVVVGSRLHGLETPKSDWDYRGIHIHDLSEKLSPFKTLKNTTWIEGDEDNTSYELADFCKGAVHGNATYLEVFFSDMIKETSPIHQEMRENWQKFIDTDRFVAASKGYAANQFNKLNLFEKDKRTPKFAVAYIRVLWQCAVFLETGKFECRITDEPLKKFLVHIKNDMIEEDVPVLLHLFNELQGRVTIAHAKAEKMTPDIEWIEDFIYRAYTTHARFVEIGK